MATGVSFFPMTQGRSHWALLGAHPAADAGQAFRSQIFLTAFVNSPCWMSRMKAGISTDTGHPSMQEGFLH